MIVVVMIAVLRNLCSAFFRVSTRCVRRVLRRSIVGVGCVVAGLSSGGDWGVRVSSLGGRAGRRGRGLGMSALCVATVMGRVTGRRWVNAEEPFRRSLPPAVARVVAGRPYARLGRAALAARCGNDRVTRSLAFSPM